MRVSWVIGSGGLLGSAISTRLHDEGATVFDPVERFCWIDPHLRLRQMETALMQFAACAAGASAWEIYWAAGVGTMRSSTAELAVESDSLRDLLRRIGTIDPLCRRPGTLAFASSAGAIYAGSRDWLITEQSAMAPTTYYGSEKLAQESMLRAFVANHPHVGAVALRLSTLYGPGQAHGKTQGLISHIARAIVSGRPIQIYVPLDTVRDYLSAADAAAGMVRAVRAAVQPGTMAMRIVASEHPTTISEIVSVFRRIARRPLRIVAGTAAETGLYARRIQFRSVASPRLTPMQTLSLPVGVAQVLESERVRHTRAAAAPPRRVDHVKTH